MDKLPIGKKIREARLAQGYTQEKLAELVSMHEKQISRIEVGKFLPNLSNLIKIFKVLDLELDLTKFGLQDSEDIPKNPAKIEMIKLVNNLSNNEAEFYLNLIKQVQKDLIKYNPLV